MKVLLILLYIFSDNRTWKMFFRTTFSTKKDRTNQCVRVQCLHQVLPIAAPNCGATGVVCGAQRNGRDISTVAFNSVLEPGTVTITRNAFGHVTAIKVWLIQIGSEIHVGPKGQLQCQLQPKKAVPLPTARKQGCQQKKRTAIL